MGEEIATFAARIDVAEHALITRLRLFDAHEEGPSGAGAWGAQEARRGRRRHLHAHHIQGWADGGATKLSNLVLVCTTQHRMLHEGKLAVAVQDQQIVFRNAIGREIPGVARSAATGHDLDELERLRAAELHVDADTNFCKWDGRKVALAEMLDCMFSAERTRHAAARRQQAPAPT